MTWAESNSAYPANKSRLDLKSIAAEAWAIKALLNAFDRLIPAQDGVPRSARQWRDAIRETAMDANWKLGLLPLDALLPVLQDVLHDFEEQGIQPTLLQLMKTTESAVL